MNTRFSFPNSLRSVLLAALAALVVTACGGGTGGTGADNSGPTNAISVGVMAKGSTIVNGVRFEDTTANIFIDDTPKTSAALQTGMVVKVAGTVNNDGINGTAQRVKALIEVRGIPTSVNSGANPQNLVVLGQTVFVDDQTVYSSLPSGVGSITPSVTLIEVHGLRDTTGRIRATRIEADAALMGDNTVDEIRGVVTVGAGTNPTNFTLGSSQPVNASGATIAPAGASYQIGSVVEVHCTVRPNCAPGGVFQASRVVVEDSEDSAFQPGSGQRLEAEGLISGFTAHPGNFSVEGTPVTTTTSTQFEGGISTDLANDIKVEAEGSWNGTRLVASKIEFKRSVIRLQGAVTASSAPSFTLTVTGAGPITVQADSLTTGDFSGGAVPPVAATCVQVRGQRKAGGGVVVTAGEILNSCSSSSRHFVQAPVEVETATNITLLGFSLDVSNPTDTPQWVDITGQPILTLAAFLNAVTPATTNSAGIPVPGTLVKVIFNSGLTTVRQAELED
jgi:hypothetical protein